MVVVTGLFSFFLMSLLVFFFFFNFIWIFFSVGFWWTVGNDGMVVIGFLVVKKGIERQGQK